MTEQTEISYDSPNPHNYQIPKGDVYFTAIEDGIRRHVGNVSQAELTIKVETQDHFSHMVGVKVKDLTVVTSKSAELKMAWEEFTPANVAIALLGTESVNSAGDYEVSILSQGMRYGTLEIIGTNDVGPRWDHIFPRVGIKPSAALALIEDKWTHMELIAEAFWTSTGWGQATMREHSSESEIRAEG